jgi:hypothetical protein
MLLCDGKDVEIVPMDFDERRMGLDLVFNIGFRWG